MERVHRAKENSWVVGLHVQQDQEVAPGFPLYDVMEDHGGVITTVCATDHGYIKAANDDTALFHITSGALPAWYVKKNRPILSVAHRHTERGVVGAATLVPRMTQVMHRRRLREYALH